MEFFWSVNFQIQTGHRDLQSRSPYFVQMRENMDQKNSEYGYFSRSDKTKCNDTGIKYYENFNLLCKETGLKMDMRSIFKRKSS